MGETSTRAPAMSTENQCLSGPPRGAGAVVPGRLAAASFLPVCLPPEKGPAGPAAQREGPRSFPTRGRVQRSEKRTTRLLSEATGRPFRWAGRNRHSDSTTRMASASSPATERRTRRTSTVPRSVIRGPQDDPAADTVPERLLREPGTRHGKRQPAVRPAAGAPDRPLPGGRRSARPEPLRVRLRPRRPVPRIPAPPRIRPESRARTRTTMGPRSLRAPRRDRPARRGERALRPYRGPLRWNARVRVPRVGSPKRSAAAGGAKR